MKTFDELVWKFKMMRGAYFNKYNENMKKFAYHYDEDELFEYVVETLDTKFSEVEQVARKQVEKFLNK